jgi:hypothetical protein
MANVSFSIHYSPENRKDILRAENSAPPCLSTATIAKRGACTPDFLHAPAIPVKNI